MGQAQRKIVWVTGGAGYIGASVVRELINRKYTPIVIDNFSSGSYHFVNDKILSRWCNLHDYNDVDSKTLQLKAEFGTPISVIHLAAESRVDFCQKNPSIAYAMNVGATYNVAHAAIGAGCQRFTLISSAAVYGDVGKKAARSSLENLSPVGIYGQTKYDAEKLLSHYFKNHLNTVILRLFNVAGARCGNKFNVAPLGKPDPHSRAIFPSLVRSHLSGGSFTMNEHIGLFLNSSPIRDFIHVEDVAETIASCVEFGHIRFYDQQPMTFNVGRGRPIKICDLLQLAKLTKEELRDRVDWYAAGHEEIAYSVAGDVNIGHDAQRTLLNMWLDEIRWQKSKLFKLIKSDTSKET